MTPDHNHVAIHWEKQLEQSRQAVEVALGRLAVYVSPNQLKLFDPSKVQSEA